MRYVAAAALAALGGGEVNEANIKKILRFVQRSILYLNSFFSSVGIEADGEKVALVVKELAGKNLEEVIAAGTEKLGSVPSGGIFENRSNFDQILINLCLGGAAAAAAPAAGGAAPAAAAAAAPPPKVHCSLILLQNFLAILSL